MVSRNRRHLALAAAGLIAVVVAGALLLAGPSRSHPAGPVAEVAAALPAPIVSPDAFAPRPSAVPAPASGTRRLVTRVRLPEVGIDLPVVEGDGWDAPLNEAAHMPGMKWPGEGGRSMLYAHARAGMFGPLNRSRVGQAVEISLADGRTLRYVIRDFYPGWPSTDTRWLQPFDREQLVLVTCTTYDPNDPRVIAVAEPV